VAEFTRSEYEFSVAEEQPLGEVFVGQVVAVDRDLPPFNEVVYSLVFPPTPAVYDNPPLFRIIAHNGTILAYQPLDREDTNCYRFTVQACSPTDACSTAKVTVHVTDINDHAPVFLLPASPNDSVSVTKHFRSGDVIATLVATDADMGDNRRISYQLGDVDRLVWYIRLSS